MPSARDAETTSEAERAPAHFVGLPPPPPAPPLANHGDASHGRRFVNLIIDTVVALGFAFVIGVILAIVGSKGFTHHPRALGIGIELLYYFAFESLFGRTIGKVVTGTQVVDENGNRASAGKLLGRTLARIIPFEPLSFWGEGARGWHDTMSGTRVVLVRGPVEPQS